MTDSVAELREMLEHSDNRRQLGEIIAITTLLRRCIIDQAYRISDDWIRPIVFTELGREVIASFTEDHRRPKPNDVRMAVFLEFGCARGLFAELATDIEALRQQLSKEILRRQILYPYIYGRELHDAAAELFPQRTRLDNTKTLRLLRALPIGSFQEGFTVVGPYGCTHSDVPRQLSPSTQVPGYLCSDESCSAIHGLSLSTADSSITRTQDLVAEFIERNYSPTADEHVEVVREALIREILPSRVDSTDNLIDVLSDGLSEAELRTVIDLLLRRSFKSQERRTDIARRLNAVIASPSDYVESIGRPELIQIALLYSDSEVVNAIDEAVHTGQVTISDFEVRISRVRRWDPDGDEPSAEIGALGVRISSTPSAGLLPRRMFRILHSVYYESGVLDAADLAYSLEVSPDLSEAELLGRAVQVLTPSEIFRRLILPSRKVAAIVADKLGIFGHDSLSREDLLERMLWKIGVRDAVAFSELQRIELHLAGLADANANHEEEDVLRGHSSNMFAAIEQALRRCISFCTWGLTVDHYLTEEGFVYDPLTSARILNFIEVNAPTDDPDLRLRSDGINSLAALSAAFARLAKALRKLDAESHRRPTIQIPAECTALSRPFAFPFVAPFLNLAESARSATLTSLQSISRLMQDDDVVEMRNAPVHGREFPSSAQIGVALGRIDSLVKHLRKTGLYPRVFEFEELLRDGLGRQKLLYSSGDDTVTLLRPGWAVAPRLPVFGGQLIIVPIAEMATSGPLRFHLKARPGDDPYWNGYPKRWRIKADYQTSERPVPSPEGFTQAS
jgi:hypothetical protein